MNMFSGLRRRMLWRNGNALLSGSNSRREFFRMAKIAGSSPVSIGFFGVFKIGSAPLLFAFEAIEIFELLE